MHVSDPHPPPEHTPPAHTPPERLLAWAGVASGVGMAVTLGARASVDQPGIVEWLARTSVPQLTLVGLLALLPARRLFQVLAGGAALAVAWSLITGTDLVNATGLGVVAPPATRTWTALLAVAVVIGAARRVPGVHVAVPVVVTLIALPAGTGDRTVAVALSALAALAWLGTLDRALGAARGTATAEPTVVTARSLAGLAVGLAACSHGAFELVARRYVERVATIDSATRLTGPVAPGVLWTVLIAGSIGLAAAAALAWRRLGFGEMLVGVSAAVFLLRIATLLNVVTATRDGGDQFFYHVTANVLARGRGFLEPVEWTEHGAQLASALHGPAFPAVLSLWSRLGATSYVDHQLASIVLGVPQVIFGVVLANVLAGRRAAIVAAVLLAAYPNIWITDGSLFVEGMMAGLTTAATWCVYRWRDSPRRAWMVAIGALIGLAALTRGEAILLVPLLLVPAALRAPSLNRPERWVQAGAGIAACLAALAPWTIYNAGRFDVFVPLSTNSNEVLFYANCDDVYSGPSIGFWSFACQERYRAEHGEPPGDQAEKAVYWRELAVDYVRDHRGQVPKVVAARVGRQWELFRPWQTVDFGFIEGRPRRPMQAGLGMYYGMMALAVAGTVSLRRRGVPVWPLWSHAVAVTLTAIYAYGTVRFRAPFEPILCVMAAVGIVALWDRARLRGPGGEPDREHDRASRRDTGEVPA